MTGRALRLALTGSLLLNAFAVGAIGGSWVARAGHVSFLRPTRAERPIRAAGETLPAPDRARFEAAIGEVLENGRSLARTARRSRRAAASLFLAPRFDPEAVATLLATARDADVTLQGRLDAAAIAVAATLPPDERASLATGLEHGGPLRHVVR